MSEQMTIGERQTVQRAKHPTLGEGRLVHDNGPAFFVADSGEVEHYKSAFCSQAWLKDGREIKFDTKGYPNAKSHQRIVRLSDGKPGWLSCWFDDFRTWCHVFEPDDGSDPFKFPVHQAWVGGEKDGGDPPKCREHLMTRKGRAGLFVYYREEDKAKADAAAKMPAAPKRSTKKTSAGRDIAAAMKGPFPGPDATREQIAAWKAGAA